MTVEFLRLFGELDRIAGAIRVERAQHRFVRGVGTERGLRHRRRQARGEREIAEPLQNHETPDCMASLPPDLKAWRRSERQRLIAARAALSPPELESRRLRIDRFLELSFPGLANSRLAFCWPIKGEYDARHFARTLRDKGALTALPVVVAPRTPLIFREWHPGVELAHGPLDIPYPVNSSEVTPDGVLLPMNGWDQQGYRLGYGGGFFDRTLASLKKKPVVIGV